MAGIDGMSDSARRPADGPACYYAYLETKRKEGSRLLEKLAEDTPVVVTDDYPAAVTGRWPHGAPGLRRGSDRDLVTAGLTGRRVNRLLKARKSEA